MNRIVKKEQFSPEVFSMEIEAPMIARERRAGQFVIVQRGDDFSERIPLTIADADPEKGTITIVFQAVGEGTHLLARLNEGEYIGNVLGPLGSPTHIEKFGTVICVGGGIGVAPLYPIAKAMKNAGNKVRVIIGARNKGLIIEEDKMRAIDPDLVIVTDDGSYGRKALVTEPLKELVKSENADQVVAIGPGPMMKFCTLACKETNTPIIVSLNTIMIDGTGMCGGCRVSVGGETKFVCVDGPEFDGHLVDWDNMMMRQRTYKSQEAMAHHRCHASLHIEEGRA
ncbi:MAG: sulfide/dihydroorotate dehydrogenase-like FAD/NAD-binding protein [Candidatus Ornithospirochaeta sp.]|nr:sulfide/dihydroorotate dehydrogenase-like FAD/NAD-binding protein [Candidatus Ornithospirochaeta sp.]